MKIFLAKNGKIHGPFTDRQLAEMRQNGEIEKFAWIWEGKEEHWVALDPAPTTRPAGTDFKPVSRALDALLHDFKDAWSAQLVESSPEGCQLRLSPSERLHGGHPFFRKNARLYLNVLDPASGESMNIEVSCEQLLRDPRGWVCELRWSRCPAFVAPSA